MPSKALFFSGRVAVGKVLDRCAEAFGVDVRPTADEGEQSNVAFCHRLYDLSIEHSMHVIHRRTHARSRITNTRVNALLIYLYIHAYPTCIHKRTHVHACACTAISSMHIPTCIYESTHVYACACTATLPGMLRMLRVAAPPTLIPNGSALSAVEGLLNGDTVVLSRRTVEELEDDDRLFS